MKKINLRDYYPFYSKDTVVEVSEEVALLLREYELLEHAAVYRRVVGSSPTRGALSKKDIRCMSFLRAKAKGRRQYIYCQAFCFHFLDKLNAFFAFFRPDKELLNFLLSGF